MASESMSIVGPHLKREAECEAVLRSLPRWFGIEESLLMYARDSGSLPTFAWELSGRVVGFLSLQEHFPQAWEIHCIAMDATARNQGHGSAMLNHAEAWLIARGVRFLQVKTIAASSSSAEYAESRMFYQARGFTALEVFPTLWSARHPALQLIKVLDAT